MSEAQMLQRRHRNVEVYVHVICVLKTATTPILYPLKSCLCAECIVSVARLHQFYCP